MLMTMENCSRALICTLPPMMACVHGQDRFDRKKTILSPARLPFHHSGTRALIDNEQLSRIQESAEQQARRAQKSSFQHSFSEATPQS
jgi:hypothetical protein